MTGRTAVGRQLAALACCAAVVVGLRPHLAAVATRLAAPRAWTQQVGADQAAADVAQAVVWLACAWMVIGLSAGLAAQVPGAVGRIGEHAYRCMLPAAVRGTLAGALGVSLIAAPGLAHASTSHPGAGVVLARHAGVPAALTPSPSWPGTTPGTTRGAPPGGSWGASGGSRPSAPSPTWPTDRLPGAPNGRAGDTVTVRPGDSLWAIAAHRLGPGATDAQIAAEWPQWYRTNQGVIGREPGLIRPGQRLHAPESRPPTSPHSLTSPQETR